VSILLRNARIVGRTQALRDVLIDGDRIRAIAPGVVGASAPDAEVVDLDGRFLGPGLWDSHVHFGQWALVSRRLDVSGARSAAEAAAIVRDHLATDPRGAGEVLVGFGFRDGLWPDAPTAELLEVGDVPVALISGDVHCLWSNRALLRRMGLPDTDTLLREQAAFDLNVRLSEVPEATRDAWALEAAERAASRGVVGVVDLEMRDAVGAWRRRFAAGFRGLRVRAGVYPDDLDTVVAAGIRTGSVVGGSDGLLVGGPFKLFTDGSLNTRTAWCADPYPGLTGHESHGLASYEFPELVSRAREAYRHGLVPTIHAIGDLAVTQALDVFEALPFEDLHLAPGTHRGSIEHAQLVSAPDLPRFAELGVRASVQPEHAIDDRDVADHYWAGRTDRAFAYRALLDAGAELALGSDAPVAPLDPWVTLAAAVFRTRDGREPWHPEQALPIADALRASQGGVARVDPGGPADLVVTERDPATASGDELRTMPVHATMVAGRWTYRE
jgi:predicted amidohydrolase YtcJ